MGNAGDEGADLFSGKLDNSPAVWQCKFFPDGIRDSQKTQVKVSLERALQKLKPTRWIVCLPIDLTIPNQRWIQRIQEKYTGRVQIEVFGAAEIVKELIYRKPIRDLFFPNHVLEASEIRSLLSKTHDMSAAELEALSTQNVDELIEHFRQKDARFNYRLTFLTDPTDSKHPPVGPVLVSVTKGNLRIDVLPRDLEALKLDPPSVKIQLSSSGRRKFQELLRKGVTQVFEGDEVISVKSTFDFLAPNHSKPRLLLGVGLPKHLAGKTFKYKANFSSGGYAASYDLIEFKVLRAGVDEVELSSISTHIPLAIQFVLPLDQTREGEIVISSRIEGSRLEDLPKAIQALRVVYSSGTVHLTDLETGEPLELNLNITELLPLFEKFEQFLEHTLRIARAFGWSLIYPETMTESDQLSLSVLDDVLADGIAYVGVNGLTATLVRPPTEIETRQFWQQLNTQARLMLEQDTYIQELFGQPVSTGPCRILVDNLKIKNVSKLERQFFAAKPGEQMPITFICNSKVMLILERLNPERFANPWKTVDPEVKKS